MPNISQNHRNIIISIISKVIEQEKKIIFAYLYGSFAEALPISNDIDIAVYTEEIENPFAFQVDIKIAISEELRKNQIDILPDEIDLRIINDATYDFVIDVLEKGILIVDKNPEVRTAYIEKISLQYRMNEIVLIEFYR
ncbi:MAG: nucleotidyltransferase domain-containing protein [Thermodesulfovibrio sp.]|nr:nucleotidyltransferase domain-containing protein [Thermodesulfovibrio sp.]